jgi:GT2 family glycosyltransferase
VCASERPSAEGAVVMTTFDRAARASESVAQLLELPDRWQVVVVDDASTDGTSDLLRSTHADAVAEGRLQVLTLDRNLGSAARTIGAAAVDTEVVAFADDDSGWAEGALGAAAKVLRDHPDVGLVAATVLVQPDGRPDPVVEQLADSPLPSSPPGPSVLGFLACGAVVRRSAYLEVGGFHPMMHIGGEEELLAMDLRAAGWRVVHVPEVVAHHRPDGEDGGRSGREVRLQRNRLLVHWMRRPARRAVDVTADAVRRGATGDPGRRSALLDALARAPAALRERRVLPTEVERDVRRLEVSAT